MDSRVPSEELNLLVLERIDPAANIYRFYVLRLEATLFGDASLVRQWGRCGTYGREIRSLHANATDARETLEHWLKRKLKRGYQLR